MNIEYVPGNIISLYENTDDKYCILKAIVLDNEKYLMIQQTDENNEIKEFELEKVLVIKLDKEEKGFEFVKNPDCIKNIILQTLTEGY